MNPPSGFRSSSTPIYRDATTRTVSADGVDFAYRQLGPDDSGVPLVLLHHLAAVLDNWDPRVVDGLAAHRRVITFDNRGVGASSGSTPGTIEAMAYDAVTFIRALGHDRVDLLGLSMGGFIAQVIAQQQPELVRRIILAGTGPAGGSGITRVTRLTLQDMARGAVTLQDPKQFMFFTRSPSGRQAGRDFLQRLTERRHDRDKAVSLRAFRAQLTAIHRWGRQQPADLSTLAHPVLLANGDSDRIVPSANTLDLAERLPNSELVPLYPDAGHGGIFQNHQQFVQRSLEFLAR